MKEIPKHLYPFENHWLELDDLRLHYLDEGDGEPVVAVHGNPTWSFYYRDLVRDLRDDYRVIVPDHIGCGLSDKPGDDVYEYTLERRIDDFSRLMDDLELDDINLVVHDWGGMIGLGWAVRNPDRVKRLVILNTAAFHLPKSKTFPWQLWMVRDTPLGPLMVRGLNAFAAERPVSPAPGKNSRKKCGTPTAPPTTAGRIGSRPCASCRTSRSARANRATTSSRTPPHGWRFSETVRCWCAGGTRTSSSTTTSSPSGNGSSPTPRSTASPTAVTTSSKTPPRRSSPSSANSSADRPDSRPRNH